MKLKRLTAILLAGILALSAVGCEKKVASKTDGSSLTLWYEAATVKIKQNDDGESVKTAKDKQILKINMARNESEGVQMMMYAKKNIDSYNVTISDLKSGDNVIGADAVDIYQLKYLPVSGNGKAGNPAFETGEIPDPMLPFDKAVEYKEAVIEEGENQSIYFDVTTTTDTPAGVYTGTVTVTTGKEEYKMPMEVTVYDVVYPDTPGLKTAFSYFDRDHFSSAELDATDEQTTAYFETLLDFNMSSWLPYEGVGGLETYIELLRKYYNEPGFNSYRLYYQVASTPYDGTAVRFNAQLYKNYLVAIAEASIEDKIDYLDKAYSYFYTVADEPASEEQFMTAKAALDAHDKVLRDADTEVRQKYAGTPEYDYYVENVSYSMLTVPYVLPGNYDIDDAIYYGLENLTFVPEISCLHTEADRIHYSAGREEQELWAYSCVGPVFPYPSGHIDDYSLGFRLTSWMCFDYDWDGYLMWGVADYLNLEYGEVKEDAWETMDTGQGRPGDGKLFYPGEKYGLDHPCPSLRAMCYRDGVDDHSLLQAVEDIYNEYGLTSDAALQDVYNKLYSGVIPTTDSYLFESVKEEVFRMIEELQSGIGVIFMDSQIELATAHLEFKTVDEAAVVTVADKKVEPNAEGVYIFDFDLTEMSKFTFKVTNGDLEKEYNRILVQGKLGGVNGFEDVTELSDYIFSSTLGYEGLVNEDVKYVAEGSKSAHLILNKDKEDTLPYFAISKESALIGGSWDGIKSMKFNVYNAGKEDVIMNATYYTNAEVTISNVTLAAGEWTLVEIAMPQDLADTSAIQEFDFNFEQGVKVELYIDSFVTVMEDAGEE